jgi:alkaline phosphatase D
LGIQGNWDERKLLNRRDFLGLGGLSAAAILLGTGSVRSNRAVARPVFFDDPFKLGVASGDPLPDGVVLWTRLTPDPLAADGRGGMPPEEFGVRWEVATDGGFRNVVRKGTATATPELGHSVHPEVGGLLPGREYFYRFKVGPEVSPVGRTKTAPAFGSTVDRLTFALASCQAWAGGPYAAYRNMALEDLDLVVHVGDYTYEGRDTETLANFRLIHARYKTSPDLRTAHAAFPFVVTFDDHEVENNWADGISQPDNEPSNSSERFIALRANAFQAYYEHLPLRSSSRPAGPDMLLYRRLAYGDLAEFNVLDTRQYRSDQVNDQFPAGPRDPRSLDPAQTMTGSEQESWLLSNLDRSSARWNILAQQTIMAQYDYDTSAGESVNHDQWDGYVAARDRIFDYIRNRRPSNPVVVTGDWHSSWVNDLKADFYDPDSETIATEFVGTSISSGCPWAPNVAAALSANPHIKFFDGSLRGYVRCDLTPGQWRSDYRVVPSATDPAASATTLSSWVVENGNPGAVRA